MNKNLKYYMNLPYGCLIRQVKDNNDTYFYGRVLELDGCQSTGEAFNETYVNLLEAMEGWLEVKLENGDFIPEPSSNE